MDLRTRAMRGGVPVQDEESRSGCSGGPEGGEEPLSGEGGILDKPAPQHAHTPASSCRLSPHATCPRGFSCLYCSSARSPQEALRPRSSDRPLWSPRHQGLCGLGPGELGEYFSRAAHICKRGSSQKAAFVLTAPRNDDCSLHCTSINTVSARESLLKQ